MKINKILRHPNLPLVVGLIVGITSLSLTAGLTMAAPVSQNVEPTDHPATKDCGECHLDIYNSWSESPHAHAFDDSFFVEKWTGMGQPGDCLACHTTNYINSTGEYSAEGVYCESCHGESLENHPPDIIPIRADTEYCGTCHTTTLSEWRKTGHATSGVGCSDCHDPHSQQSLFDDPDDLCINCHQEDMERYLEDLHVQKDIGCVDCHSLVIPPDVVPDDGIVPTGHAFDIIPATCVACHTDALHAGFSLPGYENGAKSATSSEDGDAGTKSDGSDTQAESSQEELNLVQQIQALETALASRNMMNLFQGGIVGIVLGGSTAWIVARNIRRLPEDDGDEEDHDGQETNE